MAFDKFPLWHVSLRHPAGNTPLSEGEPCITVYKCVILQIGIFSLSAAVFPRALGSVGRREPARTPRHKCGPWPRSVARALRVQSREIWQVTTGMHSEPIEPSRPMRTHVQIKQMSNRLRMSFRILLTACTDCLPTSCLCLSARARALVLVRARASLCRTIQTIYFHFWACYLLFRLLL